MTQSSPFLNRRLMGSAPVPTASPFQVFEDNPREAALRTRRRLKFAASNPYQPSGHSPVAEEHRPRSMHPPSIIVQGAPTPAPQQGSVSIAIPEQRSPETPAASLFRPTRSRKRSRTDRGSEERGSCVFGLVCVFLALLPVASLI
jgi:hypothetical protein